MMKRLDDSKWFPCVTWTALSMGLLLWGCSGAQPVEKHAQGSPLQIESPDGLGIIYTSRQDNNWEIYKVETNTNRIERLTHSALEEEGLAPSTDGRQLAFVSRRDGDYEIYTMNLNGSQQRRLTFSKGVDEKPVWLAHDSKIMFESARDGNWEIYVMDADGSNQTNLSRTSDDEADPVLSPDETRILFKSKRDGTWRLYVMDVDGSHLIPLTNSEYTEGAYDDPVWSPVLSKGLCGNENHPPVASSGAHLMTEPDGCFASRIAYVSSQNGNSEIYVMTIPYQPTDLSTDVRPGQMGFPIQNLTQHPARDDNPTWSPDGEKIAFVSNRTGKPLVYVMFARLGGSMQVSSIPIANGTPRWSPDGRWIAYIARIADQSFIQFVNLRDRRHGRVASGIDEKAEFHWIPKKLQIES